MTQTAACSFSVVSRYDCKFTGKERDSETSLDYFGARYYASTMARFMSPDWSAASVPVPYASLDDPQTLNLYGYVRNNPISKVDADGHCPNCATALIGGFIGAGVNVGITYFTNPNATRADYEGAAASGFITGAVAGFTGGASLALQVGVNATANVAAGVLERSVSTGHLEVGSKTDVAKDIAIGAAGPLLTAAGGKLANAINGKDAEALSKAAEGTKLGQRHAASLSKQAAAASAFDEAGRRAGDRTGKVIDGVSRANDNINKDKKDHQ
jgi:RHS repeat-associated protein